MTSTTKQLGIWIGGIPCAACVRRVESGFRQVPSVVDASVKLASHDCPTHDPLEANVPKVQLHFLES